MYIVSWNNIQLSGLSGGLIPMSARYEIFLLL